MSELLRLLSLATWLTSGRTIAWGAGALVGGLVLSQLWWAEAPFARFLAFVAVDGLLYLGLMMFFQAPAEYGRYLAIQAFWLVMSLGRMTLKFVLLGVALLLSAIYFIFPIDVIPDVLLGLGWIDDALLTFGLVQFAMKADLQVPVPDPTATHLDDHPVFFRALAADLATLLTWIARGATG